MKQQLHPKATWFFRVRAYISMFFAFIIFIVWISLTLFPNLLGISHNSSILISATLSIVIVFILGEIYARMSYNRWFYEFTQTNLKIERGIIWKKYSNIPYERIQNIDIERDIIARIFGFSSVLIQTAGYSGGARYGLHSEGYIPAVSIGEAEKIREFVIKKISKYHHGHEHGSGL